MPDNRSRGIWLSALRRGSGLFRSHCPFKAVGNAGHQELGHAGLGMIRILEHDSEPDPLAVTPGHLKRDLPTLREIQSAWTCLDVAPVQPDVHLLREGQADKTQYFSREAPCVRGGQ